MFVGNNQIYVKCIELYIIAIMWCKCGANSYICIHKLKIIIPMNEFSKTKIGYSLALLAALFALSPLITSSSLGFLLFSYDVSIKFVYWVFVGLLAFTVYLYALSLIKEDKLYNRLHTIGDYTYAISLLFLPSIFILFLISLITSIISLDILMYAVQLIAALATIISFALTVISTVKRFKRQEEKLKAEKSRIVEFALLDRAKKLSQDGMYDLTVIDLWNVIETSFNRFFEAKGISYDKKKPISFIGLIKENNLLPLSLIRELAVLRDMRNKSAHGVTENLTKEQIDSMFVSVEKILVHIHEENENCYYCGKQFPKLELEEEELNGDYFVCKKCAKEHPNWKDEILSMGMDS